MPIKWTQPMKDRLWDVWHQEKPVADICKILNFSFPGNEFSRNAVIGQAKRLKCKPRVNPIHHSYVLGKKRKPEVVKPIPVVIEQPVSMNITLDQLQQNNCRFPYGDADFLFCGHDVEQGPYCGFHAKLCYSK